MGGLSLTGGGILDFQLNSTNHTAGSTFNDLIIINNDGPLDLTGGATLNVAGVGGNLTAGDYDLIQFGGTTTVTGTTSNIALGTIPLGAGLSASIVFDADSVNLHIAAGVPGDYNGDGKVNARRLRCVAKWRQPGFFTGRIQPLANKLRYGRAWRWQRELARRIGQRAGTQWGGDCPICRLDWLFVSAPNTRRLLNFV